MKISFPKYGPGELLTRKPDAKRIISFVAIAFFAGVCGIYFFGNKLWLLTIAVLGIAVILLCLGAAAAIFLKQSEVNETLSAPIEDNVPRLIPQWDYRPRKPVRASAIFDISSTETSEVLSPDRFVTNDNVWFNDPPLDDAAPGLLNDPPGAEEPLTSALSPATDPICTGPAVDNSAISRYDQSPIDERTAMAE
jgi:hypothetical protein